MSGIPGLPRAFSFKNITFEKIITIKYNIKIFIVFLSVYSSLSLKSYKVYIYQKVIEQQKFCPILQYFHWFLKENKININLFPPLRVMKFSYFQTNFGSSFIWEINYREYNEKIVR